MRTFGVEPHEVLHEDDIEFFWLKELVGMVVHELLLDGSVEAFTVGIHLRRLGVRVVVGEVELCELLREVLLELRAVVGEHVFERHREHHPTELEELLGSLRGMGSGAPCEAKPAVEVFKRHDVSPTPVDEALHGIEGHAVAGVGAKEALWLPQHPLPVDLLHSPEMTDLLGEDPESAQILDESAHGRGGWYGQSFPAAESLQEDLELLFPEVGVCHPESPDLLEDLQRPCTGTAVHGDPGPLIQSRALPMAFPELLLPEEKRPPFDLECIHRGQEAVLLPEDQDFKLPLRFGSEHTVPP